MRILLYGFLIPLPASILPIQIVPWWSRSIDYNKNPLPRASFAGFGLGSRETVKCSVSGWEGPNCEFPICENGCGVHGKCVFPDICRCEMGYIGKRCHECIKHPECHNGNCIEYLDCNCYPGWTGRYCATPACRDGCSKQFGSCKVPGECVCLPGSGYQGENCTQCTRMQGCDHGYCNLPNECICEEGKYIKGLVSVITSDPTKRPKPDFQRSVHLNLQLIIQADFDTFTHTYLCTRRTHKGCKGTDVNRKLPSFHGESIKITLTGH